MTKQRCFIVIIAVLVLAIYKEVDSSAITIATTRLTTPANATATPLITTTVSVPTPATLPTSLPSIIAPASQPPQNLGMLNINWTMVSAWAALLTALVAIATLWQERRDARFSTSVDLLWRTDDLFRSNQKMLEKRRAAAKGIVKGIVVTELDDVLDFFEMVGHLMRRKALDEEMVWYNYYTRALGYWILAQKYITEVRKDDKTIWMDYEYLVTRLIKVEKRKNKGRYHNPLLTKEAVKEFLTQEITIS